MQKDVWQYYGSKINSLVKKFKGSFEYQAVNTLIYL